MSSPFYGANQTVLYWVEGHTLVRYFVGYDSPDDVATIAGANCSTVGVGDISQLTASNFPGTVHADTRRVVADFVEDGAKLLEAETPLFAETFRKGVDAYARAAVMMPDFRADDQASLETLREARDTIVALRNSVLQSTSHITAFRDSIEGTPRMTTRYNRARRRAVAAVDRFVDGIAQ